MQIFVNSAERLNSPVYFAPPCTVLQKYSHYGHWAAKLQILSEIYQFIHDWDDARQRHSVNKMIKTLAEMSTCLA